MTDYHVTEILSFKSCRRYWDYDRRQNLTPIQGKSGGALFLGSAVHHALATYYLGRGPDAAREAYREVWATEIEWSKLYDSERVELNQQEELGAKMLEGYFEWASEQDALWEVVSVETPLRVKVPGTRDHIIGTIDLLVERKNKLWVVDHKTRAYFIDPESLEFDEQMRIYLWLVWQSYGQVPGGAIYNQLVKAVPEPPPLVYKDTQVSRSQAAVANTTREMYLKVIEDNGFNVEDYQEVLDKLEFKEFFKRETSPRNESELNAMTEELVVVIREMSYKHVAVYPTPTHDCVWSCQFKQLCRAQSGGGDFVALREALFTVDETNYRRVYEQPTQS